MDDLVEFLRARLAEDEEAACQSAHFGGGINGYHWQVSGSHADDGGTYWRIVAVAKAGRHEQVVEVVGSGMSGGGAHTEQVALHAVRHDPARALREVEAGRKMLRHYESAVISLRNAGQTGEVHDLMTGAVNTLRAVLLDHARVHAEHPDFRQKWTP